MRILKCARGVVLVVAVQTTPALAMTYYLQQDLGIQNNQHLCRYSNGKVYAFNAIDLCKLSVEDDSIGPSGGSMGFKSGEYQDGMTKVCVYDVLGRKQAIRIGAVELCPLSHNF